MDGGEIKRGQRLFITIKLNKIALQGLGIRPKINTLIQQTGKYLNDLP